MGIRLSKATSILEKTAVRTSDAINLIGAGLLAVMMLLSTADVIGRYLFNNPIPGALELSGFMLVIVVFFGAAYAQVLKRHVSVDLLLAWLPQKAKPFFSLVSYFIGLSLFSLIAWQTVLSAGFKMQGNEVSSVLRIPVWPFMGIVAAGSALLALVLLIDLLKCLMEIMKK